MLIAWGRGSLQHDGKTQTPTTPVRPWDRPSWGSMRCAMTDCGYGWAGRLPLDGLSSSTFSSPSSSSICNVSAHASQASCLATCNTYILSQVRLALRPLSFRVLLRCRMTIYGKCALQKVESVDIPVNDFGVLLCKTSSGRAWLILLIFVSVHVAA
jgi:hypothetical protein